MSTHGNPDINELMAFLKEVNQGVLDGSVQRNRNDCKTMIQRMKRDFPGHDPVALLKRVIQIGKAHPFHSQNLTSFSYLIRNGSKIIQSSPKQRSPQERTSAVIDATARLIARRRNETGNTASYGVYDDPAGPRNPDPAHGREDTGPRWSTDTAFSEDH
jgi:hypothetical protein